jgi:hypothetical protein
MQLQEIIQHLYQCASVCNNCYQACLHEPEVKMMTTCIALDRECATICEITAGALARRSAYATQYISLCAEICQACHEECAKHNNEHCRQCAATCKECADLCRQYQA